MTDFSCTMTYNVVTFDGKNSFVFFPSFAGIRGRSYSGDIAIDDIKFVDCALPPVARSCPSQFTCARNSCVSNDYLCDFNDDCGDGSDETLCGMPLLLSSFLDCQAL